eukprot:jgi/Orpsp1_1/1190799/evm.model.d7180000081294.1
MSVLGYKKTTQEILDNAYIFLSNEDIRPITTLELREMIKNNVFKYAFNQMFNNLSPDTIINEEEMFHKVLHFIPTKQIKLIKDFQHHTLNSKIFMDDLDPKKSAPARYPNFKKTDKKPEIKSIPPTSKNIGRMKRFDEKRVKVRPKTAPPEEPPKIEEDEEPLEINTGGYLPLNTKLSSLTKQQRQDLIDLYMDKLFGAGDKEWKSSGNILHYERYLQAKGLNINWPFQKYQKKKRYPIRDIRHPLLSHIYVQPILINQNQKNEKELGLSQLLVGKKIEIQERKPDLDYKNNQNNIKKVSKTYYATEFNIPGNSSIKVKSIQKSNNIKEDHYPTLSMNNLSDQIRTLNIDTTTNKMTTSKLNPSSNSNTNNKPMKNENSIINANIRRLSNLNNTLYKVPDQKKKEEAPKKLEFHRVMRISSYVDYKDDIEEIEKAIKLSIDEMNENMQEQRDQLLANEMTNEKEFNYHPFMSSTKKMSSTQKIDEIIISDNKDHNIFQNTNENINSSDEEKEIENINNPDIK